LQWPPASVSLLLQHFLNNRLGSREIIGLEQVAGNATPLGFPNIALPLQARERDSVERLKNKKTD
jgi:hypothetical protein